VLNYKCKLLIESGHVTKHTALASITSFQSIMLLKLSIQVRYPEDDILRTSTMFSKAK
jgi:hypothetical protein